MSTTGLSAFAVVAALCGAACFAQAPQQLTAREIFYAPAPKAAEMKPAEPKPAKAVQRAKTPARPARQTHEAKTSEPAHAPVQPPASPAEPQIEQPHPSATIAEVRMAAVNSRPLGVRMSILKVASDGATTEVPPDTSFHPGDRVRLNIQVSDNGYLYIINRGSSGTWTQLFPSPDLPNASNIVVPGATYSVPPDRNFVVSDPPGEEKLFIILSRQPQLDVDALTLDMSRRESAKPPKELPAPKQPLQVTMAANLPPMNDVMVQRLRNAYSRDLIIEKVDESTPGPRKENAVYAVNPGGGDDSRVVLDAQIIHR